MDKWLQVPCNAVQDFVQSAEAVSLDRLADVSLEEGKIERVAWLGSD